MMNKKNVRGRANKRAYTDVDLMGADGTQIRNQEELCKNRND